MTFVATSLLIVLRMCVYFCVPLLVYATTTSRSERSWRLLVLPSVFWNKNKAVAGVALGMRVTKIAFVVPLRSPQCLINMDLD